MGFDGGPFAFGQDDFLQEQGAGFGAIEFFSDLARGAGFGQLDQIRRLERQDVVPHPGRGLAEGARQLGQGGGGGHEQAQNLHAAGIRQQLDRVKSMLGFYLFNGVPQSIKEILN